MRRDKRKRMDVDTADEDMALAADSMVSETEKETEDTRRESWWEKRRRKSESPRDGNEAGGRVDVKKGVTDEMTKGRTEVKRCETEELEMDRLHSALPAVRPGPAHAPRRP